MEYRGSPRLSAGGAPNRLSSGFSRCDAKIPERTFFATTVTWQRCALFRSDRASRLFLEVLFGYRDRDIFQLYEYVIMPDHVHLLLTPNANVSLERAMQFIKGGYSHRHRKETGSNSEIWERSFTNHRIRDWNDYERHQRYIHLNPVRARLCELPEEYPYSSIKAEFRRDARPSG